MPADSEDPLDESDLARTWRPVGTRIAGALAILTLTVAMTVMWVMLGERLRSHFSTGQRLTTVVCFLMLYAAWWAMARSRLSADPDGVTVVNGYRSHRYEWAQVITLRLPRGAPWGQLDLSDGTTLSVFGVQGSDGRRAHRAVREFRRLMERWTAT